MVAIDGHSRKLKLNPKMDEREADLIRASRELVNKELIETRALRETVRRLSSKAEENKKVRDSNNENVRKRVVIPQQKVVDVIRSRRVPSPMTPPRPQSHATFNKQKVRSFSVSRNPSPVPLIQAISPTATTKMVQPSLNRTRRRASLNSMPAIPPPLVTPPRMNETLPVISTATTTPSVFTIQRDRFRNQLIQFYTKHNPGKLKDVDTFVDSCVDLQAQLRLKYRLLRKYLHVTEHSLELAWRYALVSSSTSSSRLCCYFCCSAYYVHTESSFEQQQRQPNKRKNDYDRLVSDLIRFYGKFQPQKLNSADPSISRLVMALKEADEIDMSIVKLKLLLKYQLYPNMSFVGNYLCLPTCSLCSLPSNPTEFGHFRNVLKELYSKVNPTKLNDIDALIKTKLGKGVSENEKIMTEMKFKLLYKYGFVPVDDDSGHWAFKLMFENSTLDQNVSEDQAGTAPKSGWSYQSPLRQREAKSRIIASTPKND